MRCALAAVLTALLPACASGGPEAAPGPVLEARSGPDTLRFQDRSKSGMRPDAYVDGSTWLLFAFESTDPESLVTERSAFECRAEQQGKIHVETGFAGCRGDNLWTLNAGWDSVIGRARDLEVDLSIFRVHEWKTYEREGLMDASLDEIEMPPFLLRFAGEGESCWLAASMLEAKHPPTQGPDPAAVVGFPWALRAVTVTDAKGRALVRHSGSEEQDSALASYSTHAPGTPPPAEDPKIVYPVTIRLRVPSKWDTEVRTFRFRGLPPAPHDEQRR
jgi:hypothetical protein